MKKYFTGIMTALVALGFTLTSANAFQAAPQSAEKAKEMMEKNADKGKSAAAKAKAKTKKAEGKAKAEAAKNKPKPPKN